MTHKHTHPLATLLMATLLATSCTTDSLPGSQGQGSAEAISLWAEIDQLPVTRAGDDGFADGDRMGIYVVDYQGDQPGTLLLTGNRADNVRHTYDAATGKWTATTTIFWKDKHTHADIYGYYPFGLPQSIGEYAFSVQANQNSAPEGGQLGGYEASDFLWGKAADMAPTSDRVRLAMRHRMACARVTLTRGDGFTEQDWAALEKSVVLPGQVRQTTIDLATGTVTRAGAPEATATIPLHNGDEWRAIVVPQNVEAGTTLFDITLDGMPYRFARSEDFTFLAGRMSNFTLRVDRKEPSGTYSLTLQGESITAWENDPVSHDGNTREYIVVGSTAEHLQDSIVARGIRGDQVVSLKVTGGLTSLDLSYIVRTMPNLKNLNLKEATFPSDNFPCDFQNNTTLAHIILPDKLKSISDGAFNGCTSLTGSLNIPEGVTYIGRYAFSGCTGLTGTLTLPSTLKVIEIQAFQNCQFACELRLPEGLERIGQNAFYENTNLQGTLVLPESLTKLEHQTFEGCRKLSGSLVIPQGITEIGEDVFGNCHGLNGTLTLHDGIKSIGASAFSQTSFRGDLILPKGQTAIQRYSFSATRFRHIVFPTRLESIGANAFEGCAYLMDNLKFPETLEYIGDYAFHYCNQINGLTLPRNLEYIGTSAFANCYSIGKITCEATIPPTVSSSAFDGVAKNNFAVEVPEAALSDYQTAPGWREFKRVTAHRELTCTPSTVKTLNAEQQQTLILRAEGPWTVESMPDWCSLSQTSGNGKTELTLTVTELPHGAGDREGEVTFLLTGKDYTCTLNVKQRDYAYDRDQWMPLQQATQGKRGGIDIVLLGDGYDADDIASGHYLQVMKEQAERFFGIEPYRTYRDYFTVHTAIALSPESGIGTVNTLRDTRFGTTYTSGVGLMGDNDEIFSYALTAPTVNQSNLARTLIIVVPNSADYGGITQMWANGEAISFCPPSEDDYPYDARGIIQHEAGGHGFGKLADEYIYHNAFITACRCLCCPHVDDLQAGKNYGWYDNVSLTGKMHEVPWSMLIFDPMYSAVVDIYEGAFMHTRGVFRSEQNSCMNNNIPYFNAISRMSIVRRIKEYAGEEFTIDDFKAHDVLDASTATRSVGTAFATSARQHAPVVHEGSPLKGTHRTSKGRTRR